MEIFYALLAILLGFMVGSIVLNLWKLRNKPISPLLTAFLSDELTSVCNEYRADMKQLTRSQRRKVRKLAKQRCVDAWDESDNDKFMYRVKVFYMFIAVSGSYYFLSFIYENVDDAHTRKVNSQAVDQAVYQTSLDAEWEFDLADIPGLDDSEPYQQYITNDYFQGTSREAGSQDKLTSGLYTAKLVSGDSGAFHNGYVGYYLTKDDNQLVNLLVTDEDEIEADENIEFIAQDQRVALDENNLVPGFYIFGKDYTKPKLELNTDYTLENTGIAEGMLYSDKLTEPIVYSNYGSSLEVSNEVML